MNCSGVKYLELKCKRIFFVIADAAVVEINCEITIFINELKYDVFLGLKLIVLFL